MNQPNPSESDDARQRALVVATETLSSRVSSLADAVQTNNEMISGLRHEVNLKPDDSEVKFITGMAMDDRIRVRNRAIATAIMSALLSGFIAFFIADQRSDARCEKNRVLGTTIVNFLSDLPDPSPTLQRHIGHIQQASLENC